MKIYIASDHAGFFLKKDLVNYLGIKGYEVEDLGPSEKNDEDDYPDFIYPCAKRVAADTGSLGIVLGGTGQGEAIVANKVMGIRAAVFYGGNMQVAKLAKEHNDANILALGARFLSNDDAKKAVTAWLSAKFEGGRHKRRIEKINNVEAF